jgi:hypothetical protein
MVDGILLISTRRARFSCRKVSPARIPSNEVIALRIVSTFGNASVVCDGDECLSPKDETLPLRDKTHPPRVLMNSPRVPAHPPRVPAHPPRVPTHPPRVPAHPPKVLMHLPKVPAHPPRVPTHPPRDPTHPPRDMTHFHRDMTLTPGGERFFFKRKMFLPGDKTSSFRGECYSLKSGISITEWERWPFRAQILPVWGK